MKNFLFALICILGSSQAFAQKSRINERDMTLEDKFSALKNIILSKNGKYVYYSKETGSSIAGTDGLEHNSLMNVEVPIGFSPDSRYFIYISKGDSINTWNLKTKKAKFYAKGTNCNIIGSLTNWKLLYQSQSKAILSNLTNLKPVIINDVSEIELNKSGTYAACIGNNSSKLIDLSSGKQIIITSNGEKITELVFQSSTSDMAYIVSGEHNEIRYYNLLKGTTRTIKVNGTVRKDLLIGESPHFAFSQDGKKLFFNLVRKVPQADSQVINKKVNIWRTDDLFVPIHKHWAALNDKIYNLRAVVDLSTSDSRPLLIENEDFVIDPAQPLVDRHILVRTRTFDFDSYFNLKQLPKYYLLDLKTGVKLDFIPDSQHVMGPALSPRGKYLVWIDERSNKAYSYDINSRKLSQFDHGEASIFRQALWRNDEKGFIATDFLANSSDWWELDVLGKRHAINVTNGFGRRNQIRLYPVDGNLKTYNDGDEVLFSVVDTYNWKRGFTFFRKNESLSLKKVNLTDHQYKYIGSISGRHIVTRETADQYPNLFSTTDFKSYMRITKFSPHEPYNWLTEELHHYNIEHQSNGTLIIYKPEDFNPNKRYPTIFNFYDNLSFTYHGYGGVGNAGLSTKAYVSKGYVVCIVDLHPEPNKVAHNAVSAMEAALIYLSKYSWFDPQRTGLIGHSFGGYEVNNIISYSKKFTCAISYAGVSDLISLSGSTAFSKENWSEVERGQNKAGVLFWDNPEIFMKNSPLYQAKNISTPVLIIHGTNDFNVPFQQGVSFFTALRRLNKQAWFLSYDGAGHGIIGDDPLIRMQQFFDHYLKDQPMPIWMSRGIPNRDKGIVSGFDLDTVGKQSTE